MLKVLIADDERIARDIIALLLSSQTGIETIEEARDGAQVLEKCCNVDQISFLWIFKCQALRVFN